MFDKSLQSLFNAQPAYCWIAVFFGKSVIVKSWNIFRVKYTTVLFLSGGMRLIICWRETLSILTILSNNTKIDNCNWTHSFSQHEELKNVF